MRGVRAGGARAAPGSLNPDHRPAAASEASSNTEAWGLAGGTAGCGASAAAEGSSALRAAVRLAAPEKNEERRRRAGALRRNIAGGHKRLLASEPLWSLSRRGGDLKIGRGLQEALLPLPSAGRSGCAALLG